MTTGTSSIAFVFPGQGCQRPGMGRDFFENFAVARRVYEEASDALDLDVRALCFGDDERLDRTEFTQPAILTTELAMVRTLEAEYGLRATHFGGHSLGEYAALCAAGVMSLGAAVKLVRRRGALMQHAVAVGEGAMVAVLADGIPERELVIRVAPLGVDVANRNSPGQLVLSGSADGIARASAVVSEWLEGVELVPLNVSAPFHSRLMRVIEPPFRAELEAALPSFSVEHASRVTSNLTGTFHRPETDALVDALTRQVSSPVDWVSNMRALSGVATRLIEVGPGRPLRGFFKAIGVDVRSVTTVRAARQELAA